MKQLITVMKFEYTNFVKSSYFVVMTIIMMLTGLVLPAIPTIGTLLDGGFSAGGEAETELIRVYDPQGLFTEGDYAQYLPGYRVEAAESEAAARASVAAGDHPVAIVIDGYSFTLYVPAMNLSHYETQGRIEEMLRSRYQLAQLQDAGIEPASASAILDFTPQGKIEPVSAPDSQSAENYSENMIYAYAMIFLLYFGIMMFGQYILTSVVREKTTKTMELLITSCKSSILIHGKVIGVGLANLTQLVLLGVSAVGSMLVNAQINADMDGVFVVSVQPWIIISMLVYFLLGFFAYGYVYASLGSTVSRMEDANTAAGLPMMLIIAAFLFSMLGLFTPGAMWVTVLSYVPFFTPMIMFMRVCMGTAAGWESVLAVGLQILTIMAVGWLGGRIYRLGTLMYGKKLNLKDLAAALK